MVHHRPATALVAVKEYDKDMVLLRFTDDDSANIAVALLRKQPNVFVARRISSDQHTYGSVARQLMVLAVLDEIIGDRT